jgi:hypothetical protein
VNDHRDQLREAFEAHENQTPDPAVVYARVQELARTYKRRRWGAQAAGGAVLGAGLIAGGLALPGILPAGPSGSGSMVAPAAAPPSPAMSPLGLPSAAPTPAPAERDLERAYDAYFNAGYDYDDAVRLARLWKSKDDIGTVKAEAGRKLLAGERLPFEPSPENVEDAKTAAQVQAFFNAGYDYDDAARLADLWKLSSPYEAKAAAGEKLLDGKKLPIKPDPKKAAEARAVAQAQAFWDAGYHYEDAEKLAELWKTADVFEAKVEAGKRILAGDTLPIRP